MKIEFDNSIRRLSCLSGIKIVWIMPSVPVDDLSILEEKTIILSGQASNAISYLSMMTQYFIQSNQRCSEDKVCF